MQTRNLAIDPEQYLRVARPAAHRSDALGIREMIRPLFQLRMTRKSDSDPRATTWSSTPRTRRAISALGLRLRPAPISLNAGDCSQTTISAPRRSNASAVASPPTPPPTMAMRGTRLMQAVQFVDVGCNIAATTHPLYRTQDKPDLTISSLRSRDILQRARGWTPMNVMNCASQLTVASGGHGSARWSLGQA